MSVVPVKFKNRDGLTLFGMLHKPDVEAENKPVIVLLSPGVKMRVAPHRLYINMANQFVKLGYVVFRFDFYALGDAEGNLHERWLADLYNSVALGRYIEDTVDAMNWLQEQLGASNFILSGLCGGALTGLLVGKDDKRVTGLIGLGMPAVLESSQSDRAKNLTKGQLKELRSGYIRNLLSIKSWLRLLSFKSDFRIIFRSLGQVLANRKKNKKPVTQNHARQSQANSNETAEQDESNVNPLFGPAFFSMLETSRKMLLVFSGADRLYWEFDEKFAEPNQDRLRGYGDIYEVHTVKDANHIFSNKAWQEEMLLHSVNWLNKYFNQ